MTKSQIDGLCMTILDQAINGKEVSLPGFGKFRVKKVKGETRLVPRPSGGRVMKEIEPRYRLLFRPLAETKNRLRLYYRGRAEGTE